MSSQAAKRFATNVPAEVILAAAIARKSQDLEQQQWLSDDEIAFADDLCTKLKKSGLRRSKRHALALAWAKAKLAEESHGVSELWRVANELSLDLISVFSLLSSSLADVLCAHADELMTKREQNQWLEGIRDAAAKLSDLLRDTVLDQNMFFCGPPGCLAEVESEIRRHYLFESTERKAEAQVIMDAFARGLDPDGRPPAAPSRRESLEAAFEALPLAHSSLRAMLATNERIPTLSSLLEHLGRAAGGCGGDSEFGAKPSSKRAARKAFAARVRQVGSTDHFFGAPHLKLIAGAVKVFFNEDVEVTDLFG